jgi:FKBP-type peptidyl-prolyl cis-trans isomerase (trigger factor)
MKILSRKREENRAILEVEEDISHFETAVEKALQEAGKEIKLPGFRPGKAPREMVERNVNRDFIEQRAAQDLIAELYPELVETTKIEPVDYPKVEILKQEKDQPFVFKITVDVYPQIKLGKYKGLKVEKRSSAVTEDEVLKALGNLQDRLSIVNAEGKKETLPLDDEFAKKVSRFGTLAELKAEVREVLQKDKAAEVEAEMKNKLVAEVANGSQAEIPPAMVEREIDIMLDELRTSLAQSGLTVGDYLKGAKKEERNLRDEMRKAAEIRVKGKVVLKAVGLEEKIVVDEKDVQAEVKEIAAASGKDVAEVEKNLGEGVRSYIGEYLLRRKALDFILEKASIKVAA